MSMPRILSMTCLLLLCALRTAAAAPVTPGGPEIPDAPALGTAPSDQDLAGRLSRVFPDGDGLPAGRGDVAAGSALYARHCVACHGPEGRGGTGGELAGGNPDLRAPQPDRTIGTYWPYATTLFDFIRRAMPLHAPWSLHDDEVYALVAYLLHENGVVAEDFIASAATLKSLRMPNRAGFEAIDVDVATGRLRIPPVHAPD